MTTLTVGLQELVIHVLRVAATPQHRDKRAIASRWGSVPCRGPAPNRTVALEEAWSSRPASLPNRGEWLIRGTTYPIMQSRKRRARRERDTFFTILPAHGVTAAATLSPRGSSQLYLFPSILVRSVWTKNIMFWDSGEQVWKILIVSLLFCDVPEKSAGRQLR